VGQPKRRRWAAFSVWRSLFDKLLKMPARFYWILAAAVAIGFVGGFIFANAVNRRGIELQPVAQTSGGESDLSPNEIRKKIVEADANPSDLTFQRDLGVALYRYASIKRDVPLLREAIRLIKRAHELTPNDRAVAIHLGNALFDTAFLGQDPRAFSEARDVYQAVLAAGPEDADVRTDLGLTYFLTEPPDLTAATSEFMKALSTKPDHEKALQYLVQAHIRAGRAAEAGEYLARLEKVNPGNPAVKELMSLVGAAK
jgi:tetratricopeptide (TPR) repeat protein